MCQSVQVSMNKMSVEIVTFVPMEMQNNQNLTFSEFISQMERLHKIPGNMLQFLRGSDSVWGDQIRRRETKVLNL